MPGIFKIFNLLFSVLLCTQFISPIHCFSDFKEAEGTISWWLIKQNGISAGICRIFILSDAHIVSCTDNKKAVESKRVDEYVSQALRELEEEYLQVKNLLDGIEKGNKKALARWAHYDQVHSGHKRIDSNPITILQKLIFNIDKEKLYLESLKGKKVLTDRDILRVFRWLRGKKNGYWSETNPPYIKIGEPWQNICGEEIALILNHMHYRG